MRRPAILTTFAILAVVAVIGVEVITASSNSGAGEPAPPLPSAVLHPPKVTIADLRGAPALINFWASWCDPCRQEAPELERLSRTMPGEARLVGVDYTDREEAAREFIRSNHWTFPVLSDPNGVYGARYPFRGLPTTIAVDSRGKIVETLRGPQTVGDLRQALAAARQS